MRGARARARAYPRLLLEPRPPRLQPLDRDLQRAHLLLQRARLLAQRRGRALRLRLLGLQLLAQLQQLRLRRGRGPRALVVKLGDIAALLRRGVCRTASAAARTPVAARAQTQARWARPLATTPATLSPGEDLGSFDYGFSKDRIEKGNVSGAAENRGFTYLLMGANKFIYASAVRIGALKFIATMSATKDVLALASAEFDVSAVEEGQTITVRISVRLYAVDASHKHTGQVARQARFYSP